KHMRTSNWLTAGLLTVALVGVPTIAAAQETLNIKRSEHPLTRPEGTITPFGGFGFTIIDGIDDTFINFAAGVEYSITDDFEVGAVVLPLALSPEFDFGNPIVGARYRFLRTAVEVAGGVEFRIPVQDGADPAVAINVPVLFGLSLTTRLQVTPTLVLNIGDAATTKALSIPVDFVVNFTDTVFLTAGLGFVTSLEEGSEGALVPFNIGFGYTLAAPHIDIQAGLTFPQFMRLGFPDGVETFGASDIIGITLGATAYL
ncbi:MAG: hypothetical protein ACI9MR_002808, partial [Myxococcota bacterium]